MAKYSVLALAAALLTSSLTLWAEDITSEFLNSTSVGNTRHNMTQRQIADGVPTEITGVFMDYVRNDYGEVSVYCHTPHGANTTTATPLWNRTMLTSTTYTTYSSISIEGTGRQPGYQFAHLLVLP